MFFHHQPRGEDRILGDENHDEPGTVGVACGFKKNNMAERWDDKLTSYYMVDDLFHKSIV